MGWVETVSAIGTGSAALIALGFGGMAEYRYAKERRERRIDEERSQATRVAAWIRFEEDQVVAVVQNASDEPIWFVRAQVPDLYVKTRIVEHVDFSIQGPHTVEERVVSEHQGTVMRFAESLGLPPDWYPALELPSAGPIPVAVSFVDNAERRWVRANNGHILRVPPGQPWPDFDEVNMQGVALRKEMPGESTTMRTLARMMILDKELSKQSKKGESSGSEQKGAKKRESVKDGERIESEESSVPQTAKTTMIGATLEFDGTSVIIERSTSDEESTETIAITEVAWAEDTRPTQDRTGIIWFHLKNGRHIPIEYEPAQTKPVQELLFFLAKHVHLLR